jgi:YVTN family beta-propeller protein
LAPDNRAVADFLVGSSGAIMFFSSHRPVACSIAFVVLAAICALTSGLVFGQGPYQVVDHWKIGGNGSWDYLVNDPTAHLLYVTHRTRVEIVNTTTGKEVGAITDLKNAHGVALDTEGKFGYISDGLNNDVVVFDRQTFKPVMTVATGEDPDGITFDPLTKTIWAFNGKSSNATVIDSATNRVIATIALPGKPEFPVADGEGSVYDNLESTSSIVRLDVHTKAVVATWKLANCEAPTGLALDMQNRLLFAVCDNNKMDVVDADTGKELASPAIGDSPDAARFSATHHLAFSSNGGGTLTVVDAANGYKVIENLSTPKGAASMAYDEKTDRLFLSIAEYGPSPVSATKSHHPRGTMVPDSFAILVVGRE